VPVSAGGLDVTGRGSVDFDPEAFTGGAVGAFDEGEVAVLDGEVGTSDSDSPSEGWPRYRVVGPSIDTTWTRRPSRKVPLRDPASCTFQPELSCDTTAWRREMPGRTILIVALASEPMSAVASSWTTLSPPWWVTFSGTLSPGDFRDLKCCLRGG
jgi:hypothetical protein